MPKRVPIAAAKRIAQEQDLIQIVVIGLDKEGRQHCVTYGVTQKDCAQAAKGGEFWGKIIRLDNPAQQAQLRELLK